MARLLAAKLSTQLGQQVLVENRPGAGGTIGTAAVAKAAADGHTLLFNSAPFVTAPALYGSKLSFDTLKDFAGITKVAESPIVAMVPAGGAHKSLPALLAAAKAQPNRINFGSGGAASTSHLASALLEVQAGVQMQHVPYKGGGQAITALMGGEIDLLVDSIAAGGPFLQSGRVKALAVSGAKRLARLPDVPTFAEAGLPDYQLVHWVGLSAPAKTPAPILDKLHREVLRALAADDVKARLAEIGAEPAPQPRAQFDQFLHAEVARWGQLIRKAQIQPD
ncbi:tripartite tricarboxylate transporter substrate binding protein [Ideonella sp. TBM-1]|uniref:Tripartite tricarboxylate transporter substrate binding protein n=2 Tax=Ideonella livida TaxID=2707176 RepID=A0A7C9TMG7_9BURK|nr:tripartite tricarboxylate transporter substrate binding protein [Ideonella livida]